MSDKNNQQNKNVKPKKIDGQIIAIIALICGVVLLFGAAIAIAISDAKGGSTKTPSNSSSVLEDEWTNNY